MSITKNISQIVLSSIIFTLGFSCNSEQHSENLKQRVPDFEQVKLDLEFKSRYKGGRKLFEKFASEQTKCIKQLHPKLTSPVRLCITVGTNGKVKGLSLSPAESFSSDTLINIHCWEKFYNDTNWIYNPGKKDDFYFCLPIETCNFQDC